MLFYANKYSKKKKNEIKTKIEQNKTNQTILIQEAQQQQPPQEEEKGEEQQQEQNVELESNENQELNANDVDNISRKSAQINGNHRENGTAIIHQEDANDDLNHNKEIINPSVMEIKGIVQGEADNNVVQSASRFSAVDDEDNKV